MIEEMEGNWKYSFSSHVEIPHPSRQTHTARVVRGRIRRQCTRQQSRLRSSLAGRVSCDPSCRPRPPPRVHLPSLVQDPNGRGPSPRARQLHRLVPVFARGGREAHLTAVNGRLRAVVGGVGIASELLVAIARRKRRRENAPERLDRARKGRYCVAPHATVEKVRSSVPKRARGRRCLCTLLAKVTCADGTVSVEAQVIEGADVRVVAVRAAPMTPLVAQCGSVQPRSPPRFCTQTRRSRWNTPSLTPHAGPKRRGEGEGSRAKPRRSDGRLSRRAPQARVG